MHAKLIACCNVTLRMLLIIILVMTFSEVIHAAMLHAIVSYPHADGGGVYHHMVLVQTQPAGDTVAH